MPSSYTSPDVVVTQRQRTVSAPRITPQLPVVVVGPSVQIVTRANAGIYAAGTDLTVSLPGLADGASVIETDTGRVDVLLNAQDSNAKSLGLFRLQEDIDYKINVNSDGDAESLTVYGAMGLDYSVVSSRNNNADTIATDQAVGTPDGLWFSDAQVDFISRGVDASGSCRLVVSAPTSLAGNYLVREVITGVGASAQSSTQIRVEAVDTNLSPIVSKSWVYTASATAVRTTYGFCTAHVQSAAFTKTSNVTSSVLNGVAETISAATYGIGVVKAPLVTMNLAAFDLIIHPGNQPGGTPTVLPGRTSSAAVWFVPFAGTVGEGPLAPKWIELMAAAKVGQWLRLVMTTDSEVRDFKILAVDSQAQRILLQAPDADLSNSATLTPAAGDVTAVHLLEVMQGSADVTNASGDYVYVNGAWHEVYRATPYLIEFTGDVTFGASAAANANRGFSFRNTDASYDIKKRLSSGFGGSLLTSYRATRVDLAQQGLIDIASEEEIEQYLGTIHPDNPLAFGASMVIRGGGTAGGRVFYAVSTEGTGADAFSTAFESLTTTEDVYFVVPLSQSLTVQTQVKAHVERMSMPENKGERIAIINSAFPAPTQQLPADSNAAPLIGAVDSLDDNKFLAPLADWTLAKVGDLIWTVDSTTFAKTGSYRIKSIDIPTGTVVTYNAFPTAGATNVRFIVETYPLSKGEEAEAIRDFAKGFSSKRVVNVWPDEVKITYTDKTGASATDVTALVPGYYAACALAGYRSGADPAQPLTNSAVPAVQELVHSNTYFSPDQLNTIAEGGNLIFTQRTRNSPPVVRHQLTTDRSSIETSELSIIVAVDYVAKVLRTGLRPYIGKHNITDELLTQLRGIGESLVRSLVEGLVVRRGTSLTRLEQNKDRPDEVDMDVSVIVFYPCNRINITLFV
jgi:hypothetical protein